MEFFTLITQVSSQSGHPYGPSAQRQIEIGLRKEVSGEKT